MSLVTGPAFAYQEPSAQGPMSRGEITPTVRRVLEFRHAGFLYSVDVDAGRVTFAEEANVQPIPPAPLPVPPPNPAPQPPPVPPVVSKAKFLSLVVDPLSPDQQAWFTDPRFRAAVAAKRLEFRGFSSSEKDPDYLGFGALGLPRGIPYVVIQSEDRRQVLAKPVESMDDILKIIGGL